MGKNDLVRNGLAMTGLVMNLLAENGLLSVWNIRFGGFIELKNDDCIFAFKCEGEKEREEEYG